MDGDVKMQVQATGKVGKLIVFTLLSSSCLLLFKKPIIKTLESLINCSEVSASVLRIYRAKYLFKKKIWQKFVTHGGPHPAGHVGKQGRAKEASLGVPTPTRGPSI